MSQTFLFLPNAVRPAARHVVPFLFLSDAVAGVLRAEVA